MVSSADLSAAYNTAKAAQEKAQELATSNFTKKRGIASELKQFKEQKEEVARWEQLREQKVGSRCGVTLTSSG